MALRNLSEKKLLSVVNGTGMFTAAWSKRVQAYRVLLRKYPNAASKVGDVFTEKLSAEQQDSQGHQKGGKPACVKKALW